MKSLNTAELVSFCEWLRDRLTSAQLQDLWTDGQRIALQFYRRGEQYLVVDLGAAAPRMWWQQDRPRIVKKSKPVTLFLNSHGRNRFVGDLSVDTSRGRVANLNLGRDEDLCRVEIQLIPRSPNFSVFWQGKEIHWNRPQDLPPPAWIDPGETPKIDWDEWCAQAAGDSTSGPAKSKGGGPSLQRDLEKKTKALESLRAQLQAPQAERWRALGESLKISAEPPDSLRDLWDEKLSARENRERAFAQAKAEERKAEGRRERVALIEKEIMDLQTRMERGETEKAVPTSLATQVLKKGEASARKRAFAEFEAVIGKSGRDNLAILRQARAWDYWIHLKDEPGAHAILFRNRQQDVPPAVIEAVAEWVWQESKGTREIPGGKYQVLVVECRFVKPIKGDTLGRVNYQNPQVYTFASKGKS